MTTIFKHVHESDLKKMNKSELIEYINILQNYTMSLEEINNDKDIVRVDSNLFLDITDNFIDETLSFVKDISDLTFDSDNSTYTNWIKVHGKIRPNFSINYIFRETLLSTSVFKDGFLIPSKYVDPLRNFLYAINNKLKDLQKHYEEEGKNFLIQQLKNDIIGDGQK